MLLDVPVHEGFHHGQPQDAGGVWTALRILGQHEFYEATQTAGVLCRDRVYLAGCDLEHNGANTARGKAGEVRRGTGCNSVSANGACIVPLCLESWFEATQLVDNTALQAVQ